MRVFSLLVGYFHNCVGICSFADRVLAGNNMPVALWGCKTWEYLYTGRIGVKFYWGENGKENGMKHQNKKIQFLTQFSILLAIEAIFCFTPLGSLPSLGPIVATLAMIPVVITAILLGTKAGSAMGAFAGLFSFLVWTFMPPNPITAFIFTPFYSLGEFHGNFGSILICFVPRILVGTVTGIVNRGLSKKMEKKETLRFAISAALGSLTNTLLVMGGIWIFFGQQYASLVGQSMLIIIGTTILTSGIPEAIVAAIAAPAVCKPVRIIMNQK